MKERLPPNRLSPHFVSSDEGPETGEDSEDDLVRSYLPADRVYDPNVDRVYDNNHIPAINITLHSPNANHVLEAEICQLADIQQNIQRMREGEVLDHQNLESRLSTSCPSLVVEAAKRKKNRQSHQQRFRRRSDRNRSPSMSTGDSEEEVSEGVAESADRSRDSTDRSRDSVDSRQGPPTGGGHHHQNNQQPQRDRSSSLRPALYHQTAVSPKQLPVEAVNQLAKSVSTPHIAAADNSTASGGGGVGGTVNTTNHNHADEFNSNLAGKSPRRRAPEPTHVFIQKLIAEHGWSKQGSGTDSETECEEGGTSGGTAAAANNNAPSTRIVVPPNQHTHPSPQLTLAEFLQNPALAEEDQRKRRRNKKERGGSLFSLRGKKKDKKESTTTSTMAAGGSNASKGLTKAPSAASLSRPVSAPRVPQHSYSMSNITRRYPHSTSSSSQFYVLNRSESSKSTTEEREDVDGDKENLLESEILPGEEFPESFPLSFRNLDTDPFLRLQIEEPETWATSVSPGVAAALKPHEAKRQEHIYEFLMTEKHHCQLLKVIQKVFCEGMVTYLDMKPDLLERLFPQLDTLISIHFEFLRQLRITQDSNSVIATIADVLLNQFDSDSAIRWQTAYGAFCSQHCDAVNIYKDLLKSDRRFHEFVQQSSHNPLLRKMGIPECILTVTTRITKYPLLIEPLIKTAKDRPEEQQKLRNCLHLVKSILVNVNGQVAEKERAQRLIEIYNRLDAKSSIQVDGRKFKKSDFLLDNRKLLFEGLGTLVNPAINPGSGRGNRSPAPLLVNVVVLSDVVVFLQDVNQKYSFINPDNRSGLVPVHTLIAKEKAGSDNKALSIISTSDKEPEVYEISIVQPRDRQDWISGIRRAVDMSVGGSTDQSELESESQQAKKKLESKYMKLRQMTGELRGRDMEMGRIMEDKMRLLIEMFDEIGVEHLLGQQVKYTQLVQEQEIAITRDDLIKVLAEAQRLAGSICSSGIEPLGRSVSSVGERQSDGYESPLLPKRAETFGGFDTGDANGRMRRRSEGQQPSDTRASATAAGMSTAEDGTPLHLLLDKNLQASAAQLTHQLNTIQCMVSEHFTSLQALKVELAECKEREALGWGRYKHNQQLEEHRNLQEQLQEDRRLWMEQKQEQEHEFRQKQEAMSKLQATLEQEKKDVEQQRDKLYRKLEALRAQGIDFAPNMTVIGAHQTPNPNPEPHFIMEVRKAVSPPSNNNSSGSGPAGSVGHSGGGSGPLTGGAGGSIGSSNSISGASGSTGGVADNRKQTLHHHGQPGAQAGMVNRNLISATMETKGGGDVLEVKQQIPSKLAKLSLAGGSKGRDKKSTSNLRPSQISSSSSSAGTAGSSSSNNQLATSQQMLPYKLSESERKCLTSPKGYHQKLSSSSFAEERVGRSAHREDVAHTRTGSSPAAMTGRPMSSSSSSNNAGNAANSGGSNNTLPKSSSQQHHLLQQQQLQANNRPDSPDKSQQAAAAGPLVQRVNYADSGEEVFFF